MLVNFSDRVDDDWQYWIDANIAAGVSFSFSTSQRIKYQVRLLCKRVEISVD